LENCIERLCRDLGILYSRPLYGDPHLPFLSRLNKEFDNLCPQGEERKISIYTRMENIRNQLVEAIGDSDFEKALTLSRFFTSTCEYEFPEARFYYPYVTVAVCLLLCGRQMEAYDILCELLKHPAVDESTYGAVGYIRECQGAYGEALEYYRAASELDPEDPVALGQNPKESEPEYSRPIRS